MSARSWDSYADTLLRVLDEFKPAHVLEYGSGKSSQILAMYPSVQSVFTVEHDPEWFKRISVNGLPGLKVVLEEDLERYPYAHPAMRFDLVFVDGRNRAACLREAAKFSNLVLLHDADREEYRDAINSFTFQVWTDDGNTVSLTNDASIKERLDKSLASVRNLIGVAS